MILLLVVLVGLIIVYWRFGLQFKNWLMLTVAVLGVTVVTGLTSTFLTILVLVVFGGLLLLLYFSEDLRRRVLTTPLFHWAKKRTRPLSPDEQEQIQVGTKGWEAHLVAGEPDWNTLFEVSEPSLSDEERIFIEGPLEALCAMVDDWEITHQLNDLPPSVWGFLKENKFFGLSTAKAYGGLEFSPHAVACVLQKMATRSGTLAVTVMVPNASGLSQWLHHAGTDDQKAYYLPRLANGTEIASGILEAPWPSGEAEASPCVGMLCKEVRYGEEVLGFRVNWEKQYITLAPVSTLLGLSFEAYDPEHLLGQQRRLGMTCAVISTDAAGIGIGSRHLPLNAAFQTGPTSGRDVFVPMELVIGGREKVGQGRPMLMESLIAAQSLSFSPICVGTAKIAARRSGEYMSIKQQYAIEDGKWDGAQVVLARIAGLTYLIDSAQGLMSSVLTSGGKPAAMAAMVKLQCTELARVVVNDAMDLHGDTAICMGPGNALARLYQQLPVHITSQGGNLLIRSRKIFAHSLLRSHPCLLKEIHAITTEDMSAGPTLFDQVIAEHVEHISGNKVRSFIFGLSRGHLAKGTGQGVILKYSRTIDQLSAAFAFLADVTLCVLGGHTTSNQILAGRFGDTLGYLFLASAALKRFHDRGETAEEIPLVDWACQYALYQAQQGLAGILSNYPIPWLGILLRVPLFPTGRYLTLPKDALSRSVARLLQRNGPVRDSLAEHVFISSDPNEMSVRIEQAFDLLQQSQSTRQRLKRQEFTPEVGQQYGQWVEQLVADQTLSAKDGALLKQAHDAAMQALGVDHFNLP